MDYSRAAKGDLYEGSPVEAEGSNASGVSCLFQMYPVTGPIMARADKSGTPEHRQSKSREPPLPVELAWVRGAESDSRLQRAYHMIISAAAKVQGKKSTKKE